MSGAPAPKSLHSTGPALIAILIIAAIILGYVQIAYAPGHLPRPISTPSSSSTISTTPHNVTVTIASGAGGSGATLTYVPDAIIVLAGYNSTVIWKNNDSVEHTVTANASSPDPAFNTFGPNNANAYNILVPGAGVNFTFTVAGTYGYYCSFHSWMVGKVVVVTGPAPSSSTNSSSTSTSVLGRLSYSSSFLLRENDLASSLATLIGSGTAPWRVNLSSNLFASIFEIPAVLTKTS